VKIVTKRVIVTIMVHVRVSTVYAKAGSVIPGGEETAVVKVCVFFRLTF